MFIVHDELVKSTNTLIRQTHVRHQKQIQILEQEIHSKDGLHLILQQVLIIVIRSAQHFVDIPNYKFDSVLSIFKYILDTLKAQDPTTISYDNLTKMVNLSFQKVFNKIGELCDTVMLAPKVGPSDGGNLLLLVVGNEARNSKSKMKPLIKMKMMI